jgi:AcrR family transcriptional regulator
MPSETKDRIVSASAELFRRQGYAGTGVKQIVADAKAPFGSLYHFFPGGKQELGGEVIRVSGAIYGQLIDAFFSPGFDLVRSIEDFFATAAEDLEESDYADACPIATVALEVASTSEPLRRATAEVFDTWVVSTSARFAEAGLRPDAARELATTTLMLLEGAFILSRAMRTTEPLRIAGASASAAARAALDDR